MAFLFDLSIFQRDVSLADFSSRAKKLINKKLMVNLTQMWANVKVFLVECGAVVTVEKELAFHPGIVEVLSAPQFRVYLVLRCFSA